MNIQELKALLEGYWYDCQYLDEKIKELEKIKNQYNKVNAPDENNNNSTNCNFLIQNVISLIKPIEKKKLYLEKTVQKLPQPYKNVIYFKYIRNLTNDQIADKLNYSINRIYQLHKEGLYKLQIIITDEYAKDY